MVLVSTRQGLQNRSESVSPEYFLPNVLERLRRHRRVAHRVRDRGVAQVVLKPPGIGAPQLAQRESDLFIACSEAVSP